MNEKEKIQLKMEVLKDILDCFDFHYNSKKNYYDDITFEARKIEEKYNNYQFILKGMELAEKDKIQEQIDRIINKPIWPNIGE